MIYTYSLHVPLILNLRSGGLSVVLVLNGCVQERTFLPFFEFETENLQTRQSSSLCAPNVVDALKEVSFFCRIRNHPSSTSGRHDDE
jgi:hypothetical protein